MVKHHIRLNNSYVVKKDGKYFITSVKKPSVWKKMTEKQIDKCTKKDVTKTIKRLLKDNKVSSNINFITKKTKNKVRRKGVDKTRDMIAKKESNVIAYNPNVPETQITCSVTSFQCNVAGSGKTLINDVSLYPSKYDFLGTPIKEGGMMGRSFQPDVILNYQNNSIATKYTKDSLKNTYGFENFQ